LIAIIYFTSINLKEIGVIVMSGEKKRYVSVEEQELRRLKEQDSRLKTVQRDLRLELE